MLTNFACSSEEWIKTAYTDDGNNNMKTIYSLWKLQVNSSDLKSTETDRSFPVNVSWTFVLWTRIFNGFWMQNTCAELCFHYISNIDFLSGENVNRWLLMNPYCFLILSNKDTFLIDGCRADTGVLRSNKYIPQIHPLACLLGDVSSSAR